MPAGQVLNTLICSAVAPGAAAGQIAGPSPSSLCPPGQELYVVETYLPFSTTANFFDSLSVTFDPVNGSGLFGFGFVVVVIFYVIGLKGSVLLRHFWPGRY